ncbi:MAG: YggS family pyridoxal phosphate-dependent enzyme [Chloroflexi bacterium]|nr:YggS family pyridoxal phosphate-dependent enzyme [Chloroflexota bacterium]
MLEVRRKITAAAERAGRDPGSVTLIGIVKTVEPERIRLAYDAGLLDAGENYLQEARTKIPLCPDGLKWHFIGHLQQNKVNPAIDLFSMIHSVDSLNLLRRISARGEALGIEVPVLLEVNVGGEDTKFGLSPDDIPRLLEAAGELKGAQVQGLMCMPPYSDDPQESRPFFRRLAALFQSMNTEGFPSWKGRHLSMGMSGDYETAIEEGATMVRIGRAIFGERK